MKEGRDDREATSQREVSKATNAKVREIKIEVEVSKSRIIEQEKEQQFNY